MNDPESGPIRSRVSSPEELHDYMRVTSPRLWVLLIVIITLLIGMIAYASTMTMENILEVQAEVFTADSPEGGEPQTVIRCTLEGESGQKQLVRIGMQLRLAGEEGRIISLLEDQQYILIEIIKNIAGLNIHL